MFLSCSKEEFPNYEEIVEFSISIENAQFARGSSYILTMEIRNNSNSTLNFESSFISCFKDLNKSTQVYNLDFVEGDDTHDWDTRVQMKLEKGANIIKMIDLNKLVLDSNSNESQLENGNYNIQLIMNIFDHQSPRLPQIESNWIELTIK